MFVCMLCLCGSWCFVQFMWLVRFFKKKQTWEGALCVCLQALENILLISWIFIWLAKKTNVSHSWLQNSTQNGNVSLQKLWSQTFLAPTGLQSFAVLVCEGGKNGGARDKRLGSGTLCQSGGCLSLLHSTWGKTGLVKVGPGGHICTPRNCFS